MYLSYYYFLICLVSSYDSISASWLFLTCCESTYTNLALASGEKQLFPHLRGGKKVKTHPSIRQIITGMSYPVFIKDFIWYWITWPCPTVSWQALSPSVSVISLNSNHVGALVLYWFWWSCHADFAKERLRKICYILCEHRQYTKGAFTTALFSVVEPNPGAFTPLMRLVWVCVNAGLGLWCRPNNRSLVRL